MNQHYNQFTAAIMLAAVLAVQAQTSFSQTEPVPAWRTNDSILVLAPHPDDETIACGGVIQSALTNRVPVRVAIFTMGDNNQWSFLIYRKHPVVLPSAVERMGLVRHDEALAAAAEMGLSSNDLQFLGYPDFGTMRIWTEHWGDRPPLRTMLTHATNVPYASAFRPGAAYRGQEIVSDLRSILRDARPTRVFVSHQLDHNPDHAALFLFSQVALWDLAEELRPEVYQYLVHYPGWPVPVPANVPDAMTPPVAMRGAFSWCSLPVTPDQLAAKRAAIRKHRTQYAYSAKYLNSFMRATELFARTFAPGGDSRAAGAPADALKGDEGDGISDELTIEERAKFVGVEARTAAVEEGAFVLSIAMSRPLAETVSVSAYAFGYRRGRPFAEMPKLHMAAGPAGHRIEDQGRATDGAGWVVRRDARHVTLRIPLGDLGDPDRIFFSARTYMGEIPLDWGGWRFLDLR